MTRWVVILSCLVFACGGSTVDPLDAGDGGTPEAGPDTSGPYPCGDTTCGNGDVCIHPCCGGAPPPCVPYDDAGTCPAGYVPTDTCYGLGGGSGGCMPPPCTPPPPYCAPTTPTYGCELPQGSRDCYEACG